MVVSGHGYGEWIQSFGQLKTLNRWWYISTYNCLFKFLCCSTVILRSSCVPIKLCPVSSLSPGTLRDGSLHAPGISMALSTLSPVAIREAFFNESTVVVVVILASEVCFCRRSLSYRSTIGPKQKLYLHLDLAPDLFLRLWLYQTLTIIYWLQPSKL